MTLPILTRYLPPGTIISDGKAFSTFSINLVVRGRSSSLECCFWSAPQSLIHLRGAVAARSSSKLLISGMGKLGEKKGVVEAYSMKNSYPNYTFSCDKFKSFASLNMSCKQPKNSMLVNNDIPCAEPRCQTEGAICRL